MALSEAVVSLADTVTAFLNVVDTCHLVSAVNRPLLGSGFLLTESKSHFSRAEETIFNFQSWINEFAICNLRLGNMISRMLHLNIMNSDNFFRNITTLTINSRGYKKSPLL